MSGTTTTRPRPGADSNENARRPGRPRGVRRALGVALVGLGAFLIVAAGMIKFYAYPNLAQAPTNYESETNLAGQDVTVFNSDPDVLAPIVTDLAVSSRTIADSGADAPDGVVVWVNSATVTMADGTVFQQSTERAAFDRVSGAATERAASCEACDSWVEETYTDTQGEEQLRRENITRGGQIYKFPFDTQKKDYLQWDGTLGEATTARFDGVTSIDGLKVYRFVQEIPSEVVDQREVPGSLFGSEEASVTADVNYAMTRTLYIEPTTGAPVNRVEDRIQTMSYRGTTIDLFVGTVAYTSDQVAELVEDVKGTAPMLAGMQGTFPLLALLLGVASVAGGLWLRRGGRATV
ncbi:DUF3068 domain-containing protein [Nocardioides sp. R-C-SC26]|uniref:DUF3068 domain-containing protein n=1 Tax=Nocardioides sp. R-C-SC26 TaxID=2870414 RepID=UPI001E2CEEB7|nr:DUF3068 domain-containing protein [Nocardioides sp. R-C-SC26]